MMSVCPFFIICSLVLWDQCTPRLIPRDIDGTDSAVEELKLAKLSDSAEQSSLLQFSMFGKPYSFKLAPANSIFSPNFNILQRNPNSNDVEVYQTLRESEILKGSFYTDKHGRGSFYIQQKNGKLELDGVVDDTYMISNSQGRHTATKMLKPASQIDKIASIKTSSKSTASRRKLQHDVANVEMLIFLDQIVHNNLVKKNVSIKKYLGIFWNAVQNKYKVFSSPEVHFSLSGDMSWMTDAFIEPNKPDAIEFVQGFGIWLYKEKQDKNRFPQFDIALLYTGYDLSGKDESYVDTSTLGIARTAGVCLTDPENKMYLSIGTIEDFYAPTFAMTDVAAHEVGHLLSAGHDNPKICDDHGIMSPMNQHVSSSTKVFCNSTVTQITDHLNSDEASCLYDSPQPHLPIGPEIPIMTRDEICKMAYGDDFDAESMDEYSTDPCVYVVCVDNNFKNTKNLLWVPEGTSCGDDGKVCIKGECQ
uniref:Peptidase M12B domain-containing protein n=1 Tax=Strigamia maritima TaxID=126957 RepID=T1J945_STRMM